MPEKHLTQQDLILLMDSESGGARGHVNACALCRTRLEEIENTFAAFANLHQGTFNPQLPPASQSRAELRSRIQEAAAVRTMNWWFPATAIAACCLVIALYLHPMDLSKPKITLTPGETRNVSLADVCRDESWGAPRAIPISLRQQVFHEYGIRDAHHGAYEVDYLITPELGGADSIRNLWPEPYSAVWNAHVKDKLEQRLHGLVCSGQVDLATAQRDLSRDWIGAYKKYFRTEQPM
jgi:hypothetical protein